jgi:hypothetical protein
MLWSLVRASRAHLSMSKSDGTGQIEKILLKLEPVGGGGDLVVTEGGRTVVEQLKARPDGGPWSLREIVEAVLPDLYVACGASAEDTDFRFVTEGRMGHWGKVYKFFQSLRHRDCTRDNFLSTLDSVNELPFSHRIQSDTKGTVNQDPFWEHKSYTERLLFDRIVSEIRKRSAVSSTEVKLATQRKLWKLLGHFRFDGGQNC